MQARLFFLCIRTFFVANLSPAAANFVIESFVSSINFVRFRAGLLSRNLNILAEFLRFLMIFYETYPGYQQIQN